MPLIRFVFILYTKYFIYLFYNILMEIFNVQCESLFLFFYGFINECFFFISFCINPTYLYLRGCKVF